MSPKKKKSNWISSLDDLPVCLINTSNLQERDLKIVYIHMQLLDPTTTLLIFSVCLDTTYFTKN